MSASAQCFEHRRLFLVLMAVDAMSIALSQISSPRNAERAYNDKNSSTEVKLPVVGTLLLRYEPQASTECKSRPRGEAERMIP